MPCLLAVLCSGAYAAPLDPPTRKAVDEGQRIVQEMKHNPRGPYSRILWFCNDGTTQLPVAYGCREHGGGRQHAEYSPARTRLAELGWSVGTIFAALDIEQLLDDPPRRKRLRELALERYMIDIDNGWVLERAQGYRGRVQVESEESTGRTLLARLLSNDAWVMDNFLLMRELVRVVPHGEESDLARRVRRMAIELAQLDSAAERWRAEIHASPDATTAPRLRAWLAAGRRPEVRELGEQLADDLDLLYGEAGRRERTLAQLDSLGRDPAAARWRDTIATTLPLPPRERIVNLCPALAEARDVLLPALRPQRRITLLDTLQGLETEAQIAFVELRNAEDWTRAGLLDLSRSLLRCGYASGLLSRAEQRFMDDVLDMSERENVTLADYRRAIGQLKRVPSWATGTIRHTFAEALTWYTALDRRAARFSDDLLRGSPLWMLGSTLRLLAADADRLAGQYVDVAGEALPTAVALNAGVARGKLRIYRTLEDAVGATMAADEIVVLPETIAELTPVAGILTLGEGNPVSHVQLLARNFAIPNVAIPADAVELLEPLQGQEVLLAVSGDGNVVVRQMDDTLRELLQSGRQPPPSQVVVPQPDLEQQQILRLYRIGRGLSGRIIGPKAANLGELNRLFPGRVAPALAIPFGVYAAHLGAAGLDERIRAAFAALESGEKSDEEVFAELASVRRDIAALVLDDATREALGRAMEQEFGGTDTVGVFVRSDTNVEDLPQFTGAGLNETVPHVIGFDEQLKQIPRVWSSVLSPRALAWRSSVLANPERIYASVLLMQSVASDKSGVLITANIIERGEPGMTVSTAWGVGGAVAGEAAETLVITGDGTELVTEAKAPYRRRLAGAGGIDWDGAPAGAVLTPPEIEQLRQLAREVAGKYQPALDDEGRPRPWDIEFGFVAGELTLFQIRPLVERSSQSADALLARLMPAERDAVDLAAGVDLHGSLTGELQ